MRISDWSSDVCSSDLRRQHRWNRDWRSDRRYDWRSYRERNRSHYRMPRYYNPYRGYGYTRFSIGFSLNSLFYGPRYWINDPGRSEEHTSELQSLMRPSYAVFCLKKKNIAQNSQTPPGHGEAQHNRLISLHISTSLSTSTSETKK